MTELHFTTLTRTQLVPSLSVLPDSIHIQTLKQVSPVIAPSSRAQRRDLCGFTRAGAHSTDSRIYRDQAGTFQAGACVQRSRQTCSAAPQTDASTSLRSLRRPRRTAASTPPDPSVARLVSVPVCGSSHGKLGGSVERGRPSRICVAGGVGAGLFCSIPQTHGESGGSFSDAGARVRVRQNADPTAARIGSSLGTEFTNPVPGLCPRMNKRGLR